MPLLTVGEMSEVMKNNHMTIFWHRSDEKKEFMSQIAGIHRIMWQKGEDKQKIIFKCLMPHANEWIANLGQGELEIRYVDIGPIDNPFLGVRICMIKNIEVTDAWVNKLTSVEYNAELTLFHFMALCNIEWEPFSMKDLLGGNDENN